jgi:hypothetical protein
MIHGKYGTYTNRKCRCAECRAAWAEHLREFFHKRKAAGKCKNCSAVVNGTTYCEACRFARKLKAVRATAALLLVVLVGSRAWAGLQPTVQWDVRTTGSNANGGGFDTALSGTDFSQQNAAQIAYADLVIGATTTQYTSVAHPVVAADVGNIVNITGGAGCTVGRYEIVSQAAGVATVDRSMGTAASTCTANLGGSLLTIATAFSVAVNHNGVYVQTGTYSSAATLSTTAFLNLSCYQTTHGDDGTRALITTATNGVDLLHVGNNGLGIYFTIDNCNFSSTAGTPANGIVKSTNNGPLYIRNSKLSGFTIGINGNNGSGIAQFSVLALENVEIASCSTAGVDMDTGLLTLGPGTYIHNCTGEGILGTSAMNTVGYSVVLDSNGYGVYENGGLVSLTNSVASNSTTDGVNIQGTGVIASVGTVYYGNGAYGLDLSSVTTLAAYTNNAYGANTSGTLTGITLPSGATANDVTLSANPFTSSSNFALNSTAGGGASLKTAGFPGTAPFGSSTSLSIGALQAGSAGSSTHVCASAN